jgi:hypothetical protein
MNGGAAAQKCTRDVFLGFAEAVIRRTGEIAGRADFAILVVAVKPERVFVGETGDFLRSVTVAVP